MNPSNFLSESKRVWEFYRSNDRKYILLNLGYTAMCAAMTATGGYFLVEGNGMDSALVLTGLGFGLGVKRIAHIIHDSRTNRNYS